MLSVLELFRIGIGPSSSHTVGPMRIAATFLADSLDDCSLDRVKKIEVRLQGSLALTGAGHGTPRAIMLGLSGFHPETLDPTSADDAVRAIQTDNVLLLGGVCPIEFVPARDIVFDYETVPEIHPNRMTLLACDASGRALAADVYYSLGGGFVASELQLASVSTCAGQTEVAQSANFSFGSACELLQLCDARQLSIAEIVLANEDGMRPRPETECKLDLIIAAMNDCIERGLATDGILPGGLNVIRRAPALWRRVTANPQANEAERLFDLLNVYALAVSEENAAGGKIVTAPTNGAAGILPAVMRHYCDSSVSAHRYLLTAGAIGLLYKERASISGAEMGCQGEIGVACSMAAAGLAAVWNGSPLQVLTAAEIGMEHNLGLTCDPVGGLVQIPCIERNAVGATKAVNAARLALHSSGVGRVTLDQVIETMRQTGQDMSAKYKETSQGGLALNVVEC